ncbi:unnamed protein product [Orchesella dallaii]|uniref:Uncharacterized protein n=1 Tax=Orchesella dallaii TaxID=48710 RepID=A0ABP1R9E6_9HEXA
MLLEGNLITWVKYYIKLQNLQGTCPFLFSSDQKLVKASVAKEPLEVALESYLNAVAHLVFYLAKWRILEQVDGFIEILNLLLKFEEQNLIRSHRSKISNPNEAKLMKFALYCGLSFAPFMSFLYAFLRWINPCNSNMFAYAIIPACKTGTSESSQIWTLFSTGLRFMACFISYGIFLDGGGSVAITMMGFGLVQDGLVGANLFLVMSGLIVAAYTLIAIGLKMTILQIAYFATAGQDGVLVTLYYTTVMGQMFASSKLVGECLRSKVLDMKMRGKERAWMRRSSMFAYAIIPACNTGTSNTSQEWTSFSTGIHLMACLISYGFYLDGGGCLAITMLGFGLVQDGLVAANLFLCLSGLIVSAYTLIFFGFRMTIPQIAFFATVAQDSLVVILYYTTVMGQMIVSSKLVSECVRCKALDLKMKARERTWIRRNKMLLDGNLITWVKYYIKLQNLQGTCPFLFSSDQKLAKASAGKEPLEIALESYLLALGHLVFYLAKWRILQRVDGFIEIFNLLLKFEEQNLIRFHRSEISNPKEAKLMKFALYCGLSFAPFMSFLYACLRWLNPCSSSMFAYAIIPACKYGTSDELPQEWTPFSTGLLFMACLISYGLYLDGGGSVAITMMGFGLVQVGGCLRSKALDMKMRASERAWMRRYVKSFCPIKCYLGQVNYIDELTPLNLLEFCINQTVSLLMIRN